MKTILILSANPKNSSRLRLDEEVREIQLGLERSINRGEFQVVSRWALRTADLRRALLDYSPQVVHFAGHGVGTQGLVLEDTQGQTQKVSAHALGDLFKLFAQDLECVLLNACYSSVQADAIYQHIDCVVGMNQAVGDEAAIEFAKGFYDALGAGRNYQDAFDFGCNGIDLRSLPDVDVPILRLRNQEQNNKPRNAPRNNVSVAVPDNSKVNISESSQQMQRMFISYRAQEPDQNLAQTFHDAIQTSGFEAFMAGESIRLGEDWAQRIDTELAKCDYFMLLLSERSAVSEMVTEEVRRAKQLRDQTGKPMILPIRVNFPIESPLNYDLRGYLQRIQQREWHSEADTQPILQEILALLQGPNDERPQFEVTEGGVDAAAGQAENEEDALESPEVVTSFVGRESIEMPPLPVAEPELPGGQVDLASQFYLERPPLEARCYEAIVKPGALIRIKAPRQMGKTSLMSRVKREAEQQGALGVTLSFQIADSVVFSDLDRFLRWFALSVGRRLKLPNQLKDYWDEVFGSKDNCTAYFEEYLLESLEQPLTLCLDEVDMVFEYPKIAADFFGLLRNWHEMGKTSDLWKRFRLVVVHSTEVYIPMNINQSPFNVGLPIELPEFSAEQVQDLAQRHGLSWNTSQIGRLMGMVGGHSYLIRLALYHIARDDLSLSSLLAEAPTESGLYGDHLRRHLWNLEQHPNLAQAVLRLMQTDDAVRLDSVEAFQLHSMGLVDLMGNDVTFRSELYRLYFGDRLSGDRLSGDHLGSDRRNTESFSAKRRSVGR